MTRHCPPDRRDGELVTFDHDGVRYTAQFSRDESGAVSELFLNCGKEGTTANIVARECAVILSIAVQSGTSLETIFAALPKLQDGKAAGPVGKALTLISAKPDKKPALTIVEEK